MRAAGSGLLLPAYFCLLAVIVFATQFSYAGFYDKHHGWVSSHGLAIASHATLANGFVGHARLFVEEGGALDYDYFDRYPVFYSALLGALIRLSDDLATQVFIARQPMHACFVLALLFAWLLLRRLGLTPVAALVAVAVSPRSLCWACGPRWRRPASLRSAACGRRNACAPSSRRTPRVYCCWAWSGARCFWGTTSAWSCCAARCPCRM